LPIGQRIAKADSAVAFPWADSTFNGDPKPATAKATGASGLNEALPASALECYNDMIEPGEQPLSWPGRR
jgi:hypothetical protein